MQSRIPSFIVSCATFFLLASCLTFNSDDDFLLNKLDYSAKARALVDAGAATWNARVIGKDELERIPEVKATMQAALRFDPLNSSAQRWLGTIEDFRNTQLRQSLGDARALIKKTQRGEDDDFILSVAVQRAARIDPANNDVNKLLQDSASSRSKALKLYLTRASAALDKIQKTKDQGDQDRLRVEAYTQTGKALAVEPGDATANSYRNSLLGDTKASIASRLSNLPKLLDAGKFSAARTQVDSASDLNDKLGDSFDADVNAASYSLYFRWAQWLADQKDWSSAQARVSSALSFNRSPEAVALLQKINAQNAQTDKSVPFDTSLQNLDKQISDGNLVSAQRTIANLAAGSRDQGQQDQLDIRRKKIRDSLADSYAKAVQLYKSESFGPAIEAFQAVLSVDSGYEQAADYLDKAKAKKKLLDQY